MRRTTMTPLTIAWFAALAGALSIASALTPELVGRLHLVEAVLPPPLPDLARTGALAFGLGLIWLARGLARRKQRAWALAVVLVAASAAAHLLKGLDVEEAAVHLVLLLVLVRSRRVFVAPGDPATIAPLVQLGLASGAVVGVLALRFHDGDVYSGRIADGLALLLGVLAARALLLLLRPLPSAAACDAERTRAAELVRVHGTDSLAYFALRRDKSYVFSPSGRSFLAYRVVGGTALVAGDPIGDEAERKALIEEFRRISALNGWRVAIAGASAEALRDYAELGFRSLYLGDEAVIKPAEFSLEGRAIRKVRQSVSRLEKAGYSVRVLSAGDACPQLREELGRVSREWRGNWPERGFTMAMDALFFYPDTVLAVAVGPDGEAAGFLQLVPSPASDGYSLASMRRRRDTPNGLIEFLVVEATAWARGNGVSELSLNFSVFADFLRADEDAPFRVRVFRRVLLKGDRLFQLERLHSFNRKFFPEWRRRYFCFERWSDLPLAGLAYLQAESLLTPPGPWVKAEDLAAR